MSIKRYFRLIVLVAWLSAVSQGVYADPVVYSSGNPAVNPWVTESSMLQLDLKDIFSLNNNDEQLRGGILGKAAGGKVILSLYYYNRKASDGKGGLLYSCTSSSNSTGYVGAGTTLTNEVNWWAQLIIPWSLQSSWLSTDIKTMALYAGVAQTTCEEFGCATQFLTRKIPVIVEVSVVNATVSKIKVPVLGEFNFGDLFTATRPIAAVNGKITLGSHRGDWQDTKAPENTRNSTSDMITEGYDMIELDLWNTRDSQVIVFHDQGLNKRTTQTGSVQGKNWSDIQNLYIKNRFDELIESPNTKISLLSDMLDYIKQLDPSGRIFINLDRSANDIRMFKQVYKLVDSMNMLDHVIFKGRFAPEGNDKDPKDTTPTAASIRQAFIDMYPSLTQVQRDTKMKLMYFTPVLFDNSKGGNTTNDDAYAKRVKIYIDDLVNAGIADGFELNFKSNPRSAPAFANANNDNVFLLRQWLVLGNQNFVQYVHSKGLPVGIFASVPEVCAIPNFKPDGTRDMDDLRSGFVKEDLPANNPPTPYNPKIQDQGRYDFRGDWDFYIPAGVDFVITDRPDALRVYLKAINRF
jgi:glycerophosphoryl diester phosphodiesterase